MKMKLGLSINQPVENVFASGLFDCIEYSIGADFDKEGAFERWEEKTVKIKELCRKYNVKMHSYHIPFNGERLNDDCSNFCFMHAPASLDKEIRDRTMAYTKRQIEFLADTGVRFVILHGSLRIPPEERSIRVDLFVEYVRELCDFCKPYGITVAVETLLESCVGGGGEIPENRIAESRYIMEQVCRDNLGICLDNNHFIKSSHLDFVKELGQYVVTTHFSDYDGVKERHAIPGNGITDWKKLTSLLLEKGYCGPWLFEIKFERPGFPTDDELQRLVGTWKQLVE
jgi:sugar phosphate isomerase/epimerase